MQFGIKSLLGAMVLLATFVMGVFQFSDTVCISTLLIAHALSPAVWIGAFYGNQSRGLKTFSLGGIITGITPWIYTIYTIVVAFNTGNSAFSSLEKLEQRPVLLACWSASGVTAIGGGLLSYWVYRCCNVASGATTMTTRVKEQLYADPLAADEPVDN